MRKEEIVSMMEDIVVISKMVEAPKEKNKTDYVRPLTIQTSMNPNIYLKIKKEMMEKAKNSSGQPLLEQKIYEEAQTELDTNTQGLIDQLAAYSAANTPRALIAVMCGELETKLFKLLKLTMSKETDGDGLEQQIKLSMSDLTEFVAQHYDGVMTEAHYADSE